MREIKARNIGSRIKQLFKFFIITICISCSCILSAIQLDTTFPRGATYPRPRHLRTVIHLSNYSAMDFYSLLAQNNNLMYSYISHFVMIVISSDLPVISSFPNKVLRLSPILSSISAAQNLDSSRHRRINKSSWTRAQKANWSYRHLKISMQDINMAIKHDQACSKCYFLRGVIQTNGYFSDWYYQNAPDYNKVKIQWNKALSRVLESFSTAIRLNQDFHEARYFRALLLIDTFQYKLALKDIDYLVKFGPKRQDRYSGSLVEWLELHSNDPREEQHTNIYLLIKQLNKSGEGLYFPDCDE